MTSRWLIVFLAITVTLASALQPIERVGSKFFNADGSQFFVKGAIYEPFDSVPESLSNSAQCKIDVSLMKSLGLNTLTVLNVDASLNHDDCMNTLASSGIYVFVILEGAGHRVNTNWTMDTYNAFTAIIDAFQRYNNTLGFTVSVNTVANYTQAGSAPFVKAAARDLKAYRDRRGYRTIPIGYFGADDVGTKSEMSTYLACQGSETLSDEIEYYAVNQYSWCGNSSFTMSGYNELSGVYSGLNVPVFFAADGCYQSSGARTFEDQPVVFGSEMAGFWSGAIIYEWSNKDPNWALVNYTSGSIAATPTPLQAFSNLQTQWATVTAAGVSKAAYTPATTSVLCPISIPTSWTVNPSSAPPTIAGLDLSTVSRIGTATNSASGTSTASTGSSGAGDHSNSKFPTGAAVGIAIGILALIIVLLLALYVLRRIRSRRPRASPGNAVSDAHESGWKEELEANQAVVGAAGPVFPRAELHADRSLQRKPVSHSHHSRPESEISPQEMSNINAPWRRPHSGYEPVELYSQDVAEFGGGESQKKASVQEAQVSSHASDSQPTSDHHEPQFDDQELSEDADVAVQELGLISVRKRALVASAATAGVKPEDLPGRRGEEYKELIRREEAARGRLDEIERQRTQTNRNRISSHSHDVPGSRY